MVEPGDVTAKKTDTNARAMLVVAGALQRGDGLWLMHQRPLEKHHGGLWEFPGGMVEPSEIPKEALCRELAEELGVSIAPPDCEPLFFAETGRVGAIPPIVILLYRIARWGGDPRPLEGGSIGWFTPRGVEALEKPPLDVQLASRLFD